MAARPQDVLSTPGAPGGWDVVGEEPMATAASDWQVVGEEPAAVDGDWQVTGEEPGPKSWGQRIAEKLGRFGDYGMPGTLSPETAKALAPIAARLPGNIKSSIAAGTVSGISAAGSAWAEFEAATARRQGEQAAERGNGDVAVSKANLAGQQDAEAARLAGISREARLAGQEAIPPDAGVIERGIQSGVASAAQTLPLVMAGGPVGGTVAMGALAGADRYRDARDQGVSQGDAIGSGVKLGALEALTEFIPASSFMKAAVGNAPLKRAIGEFVASDLIGENATTIATIVDDYALGLREDVTVGDVIEGIKETTVAVAAAGGLQGSVAGIMRGARERANLKAREREASQAKGPQGPRAEAPSTEPVPPSIPGMPPSNEGNTGIPTEQPPAPPVEEPGYGLGPGAEPAGPSPTETVPGAWDVVGEEPAPPLPPVESPPAEAPPNPPAGTEVPAPPVETPPGFGPTPPADTGETRNNNGPDGWPKPNMAGSYGAGEHPAIEAFPVKGYGTRPDLTVRVLQVGPEQWAVAVGPGPLLKPGFKQINTRQKAIDFAFSEVFAHFEKLAYELERHERSRLKPDEIKELDRINAAFEEARKAAPTRDPRNSDVPKADGFPKPNKHGVYDETHPAAERFVLDLPKSEYDPRTPAHVVVMQVAPDKWAVGYGTGWDKAEQEGSSAPLKVGEKVSADTREEAIRLGFERILDGLDKKLAKYNRQDSLNPIRAKAIKGIIADLERQMETAVGKAKPVPAPRPTAEGRTPADLGSGDVITTRRSKRLFVVACSNKKERNDEPLPAERRYKGAFFETLRAMPPDQRPDVMILSAKFGLIGHDTLIPNYDEHMTSARAAEILADPDQRGRFAATFEGHTDVFIAAGETYRRALGEMLKDVGNPVVAWANGGIGMQKGDIKRWLHSAPASEPEDFDPFSGEPQPDEPMADKMARITQRIATDQELRDDLVALNERAGWAEKGGRMITRGDFGTTIGGGPDVVGRTVWTPRELWWADKPPGLTEATLDAAVKRALAGKKLGIKQQEAIRFLVIVADENRGRYDEIVPGASQITQDEVSEYENPTTVNIGQLAQMASQYVDEDIIEAALDAQTDAEAIRRLEAILKEHGHGFQTPSPDEVGPGGSETPPGEAESTGSVPAQRAGGDIFGGSDRSGLNDKNAKVARKLGQGRGPVPADNAPPGDIFRDAADKDAAKRQGTQADLEDGDVQAMSAGGVSKITFNPGAAYAPMYQSAGAPGAAAATIPLGTAATGTKRDVKQDAEPVRREHIMALFQRVLGLKIYQGKPFKVRGALGYFRPTNFEVRNKNLNDLEVAAHEVFHWLDRSYPTIRKLYHQKRFDAELRSISYDAKKLDEGFAEFGRLFMTKETAAVAAAPDFYTAFIAEARAVGVYDKLARVQEQMHKWYLQGADARARSKIGEVPPPVSQQLTGFLDGWGDRATALSVDYLHAAKVIERETQGGIARDAVNSPYKSLRLLAGARATANTFLNHGTLRIGADGAFEFSGDGLRQIFEPIGNEIEDAMAYFVGRRAAELKKYGKERLLSGDEIEALLARGLKSPRSKEIRKAFDDYQAYTERLLDFAEQSGIVSGQTRAIWRSMYQNYVPFYRVSETLGGRDVSGKTGAVFKRLKGGTGNLRDTWENIALNTATIVHASLKNQAKRQLFRTIASSPLGQKYAVKIPTDTHAVPVAMRQVEQVLRDMVQEAQARATDPQATAADKAHYLQVAMALDVLTGQTNAAGGAALDAMQSQATFFTQGHPPTIPDKDFVLVDGERVWYQIGDPMLWDMLTEINVFKPLGLAEKALGLGKRVLTRGVTVTPEFQIANLLRDSFNAFTMSRGGQLPVVDSLRAFRDIWSESEAYKLYLANGGGFGNAISDEAANVKLRLHRFDRNHLVDTPAKLIDFWDKWGQSFELATRLAEFKRMKAKGASSREAAFQGREISSDFAMRGSSQVQQLAITSLPFYGARLQGLYKLERELFEKKGRQSWTGERALTFAARSLIGLTLPSLLLYWFNKDDEDYQALPEETKNLFWPVKIWWTPYVTGKARFLLIPKPFEVGALFATIPERIWQSMTEGKPKALVDAALFTLVNTFQVDPVPQLVKPAIDVFYRNRYWTGAPIVPRSLENVEPSEQYRPWTAKSMVEIGERFNVSPLKLEALVNGYLGTIGQYTLMAADSLVSTDDTGEDPTKRMSQYPVFRRFLREQPYTRTAYETRFYELADEVTVTVQTMAKLRREAKASKIERYLGDAEKAQLFALGGVAAKVQDKSRDIDAAMRHIKESEFLTADQKREQMDTLQAQQNELFKQAVTALDTDTLERYRNALEGRP